MKIRDFISVLAWAVSSLPLTAASGHFELEILSLSNSHRTLASGECCNHNTQHSPPSDHTPHTECSEPCQMFIHACLKEYQTSSLAALDSNTCKLGNTTSGLLNVEQSMISSMGSEIKPIKKLDLPFDYAWMVSKLTFLILQQKLVLQNANK